MGTDFVEVEDPMSTHFLTLASLSWDVQGPARPLGTVPNAAHLGPCLFSPDSPPLSQKRAWCLEVGDKTRPQSSCEEIDILFTSLSQKKRRLSSTDKQPATLKCYQLTIHTRPWQGLLKLYLPKFSFTGTMSLPSSLYQLYTGEGVPSTERQESDVG